MENKPSIVVVSIGYGVIIALAMIVFSLILFLLNISNSGLQYLNYLILLGGLFLAQTNFRNKYLGGYIEYGKAFSVGLITSVFLSLIMGIYTFIFFKYIDPGAMEEMMSMAEQKMMDRGMSQMEIDQGMAIASKFQGVGFYTFFAVAGNIFFGAILSLITAIFVKKENTDFGSPAV